MFYSDFNYMKNYVSAEEEDTISVYNNVDYTPSKDDDKFSIF